MTLFEDHPRETRAVLMHAYAVFDATFEVAEGLWAAAAELDEIRLVVAGDVDDADYESTSILIGAPIRETYVDEDEGGDPVREGMRPEALRASVSSARERVARSASGIERMLERHPEIEVHEPRLVVAGSGWLAGASLVAGVWHQDGPPAGFTDVEDVRFHWMRDTSQERCGGVLGVLQAHATYDGFPPHAQVALTPEAELRAALAPAGVADVEYFLLPLYD